MKRIIKFAIVMLIVIAFITIPALASDIDFDWNQYSLDELLEIQTVLTAKIDELQRAYAIDHGDRIIHLDKEETIIYKGKSDTVAVEIEKVVETAPEQTNLIWTCEDESIAKVSNNGMITGVSEGNTVITCTAEDNEFIFAELSVNVVLPVTTVSFEEGNVNLLMFEGKENSIQLFCTVQPDDAYCKAVSWTSANEEIAVVDDNGVVTAVAPGKVVITATTLDEFSANAPKKATCTVNVLQAVSKIEFDTEAYSVNLNGNITLKPTVFPETASNKNVIWESSNPDVAKVSANGQVTGVACGQAAITCYAADGSGAEASCKIEVIQMVTGITFDEVKNPLTLNKEETRQLSVTVKPEFATNPNVEWTSSDSTIVSTNNGGEITGVSGGTATITCTALDGSEKTVSLQVFVPSISIEKTEYYVDSKEGMVIKAKYYGDEENFEITPVSNAFFDMDYSISGEDITINVKPKNAGLVNLVLKDKSDSKNNRTVAVKVEHSAVYDNFSYPIANYTEIMRSPNVYSGEKFSIYGKILQKSEGWFSTTLRIGTSGWGYYDEVFYVTVPSSATIDVNVIEDDMVTIYGECTGTETYKTILGGSITIPSMDAEKIVLGR